MSLEKRNFKRPNSDKILAAPASQTGGIKGIIAGRLNLNSLLFFIMKHQVFYNF